MSRHKTLFHRLGRGKADAASLNRASFTRTRGATLFQEKAYGQCRAATVPHRRPPPKPFPEPEGALDNGPGRHPAAEPAVYARQDGRGAPVLTGLKKKGCPPLDGAGDVSILDGSDTLVRLDETSHRIRKKRPCEAVCAVSAHP